MISSVPKFTPDMQGMNHDWQKVISYKILQFLTTLHIITQKPHKISHLNLVFDFSSKEGANSKSVCW